MLVAHAPRRRGFHRHCTLLPKFALQPAANTSHIPARRAFAAMRFFPTAAAAGVVVTAAAAAAASAAAQDAPGWVSTDGVNACDTPSHKGPCGTPKDAPGFHFVGSLPNASECAATCEAAQSSVLGASHGRVHAHGNGDNDNDNNSKAPVTCDIWLYSASSRHCWWRLDGVWDPVTAPGITSGCRAAPDPSSGASCVAGCGGCPATPAPAPAPLGPVITGSGAFRYQYEPAKLVLPAAAAANLRNGHGVTRDKAGRIYFTYESFNKSDPAVRALARWDAQGENCELLGDTALAQGVPHGLKIAEEGGVEYLYHGNNAATVTKTTLDGEVVWTRDMTAAWQHDAANWPFKPTDVVVPPNASAVFVADGYGSSKVHEFDLGTGNFTGAAFGGPGSSDDPLRFNCDHGISWDDRVGALVVSDRANHRLRWVSTAGELVSTLDLLDTIPLPCNAQTSAGTALGGDFLVVPGLGVDDGMTIPGNVGIFNRSNDLVSVLEVAKLLGSRGFLNPHDAIFTAGGDIALAVWKGHDPASKGSISYWTRVPE